MKVLSRSLRRPLGAVALAAVLMAGVAPAALAQTASQKTASPPAPAALKLNAKGYFETRGLNVLVFSNGSEDLFNDAKMSGVELIQHGVRTVTNGDVRLSPTPGQWDPMAKLIERKVDPATGVITATLEFTDYAFRYQIQVKPDGAAFTLTVILDKPLPAALEGKAGFNLEVLPSAYFRKTFLADGRPGGFPLYPSGPMAAATGPANDLGGRAEPLPLVTAGRFVLAPEDPARRITITSAIGGPVSLYDGRNQAQNGWYVLRAPIPAGKTGRVVEWTVSANALPNWVRPPSIAHSQLGYTPSQKKVAIVERDPADPPKAQARLLKVDETGAFAPVLAAPLGTWTPWLRYAYAPFDFSSVKTPGLYVVEYAGRRTAPFRIDPALYDDAWHPTLDVYFPVAMDHMFVNEAYRVWHGDSHRDDALQAPLNHEHIDLYRQGSTTDTPFKPMEHIPGLNVGGWFDAGDFDIRTQTHYAVVRSLVDTWEQFHLTRDETSVDQKRRHVEIHVPDGTPDLLQQIEHGTLQLLAQHKAVGHAINGIVEPDVGQYTHLGDAVTKTDGLVYDASLGPDEAKDGRSGVKDDRWAFTSKSTPLNYGSIAALAAASRALRGYRDALADDSLATAQRVWDEEHSHAPDLFHHGNTTGGDIVDEEFSAAVELLIATKDPKYAARIDALWPQVEARFIQNADLAARAVPFMPPAFRTRMEPAVRAYKAASDKIAAETPFGVPIAMGGWAGSGGVAEFGLTHWALHKAFPEIIDGEAVFRSLNYLYGTHPGSDISLVSAVGTVSKEVAYGNNRADFSFIAGGVVPGELIVKPDFPENKEDWPFFWGENEYVINVGAAYIQLVNAAAALSKEKGR
ncbi:glycoside hydrolase family 9 protein [Caulobacter sp. Root1455]|uniref:glycoside hydrolase family 9 protein n=1 Tax=Caulobacter sp. Root1455 TaxID=1736465 RepID=UPI0009E6E91E|nr:glycoside hydrolase family 9 protein [Caulobacter sp. Root1455]